MATKLKHLTLNEVSLVDRGANQHAHVTLFKRDGEAIVPAIKDDARAEADKALAKSLVSIMIDPGDTTAAIAETFKQYHDHLAALGIPAATDQPIIKEDDMSEEITKKLAETEATLAKVQKELAFAKLSDAHKAYIVEKALSAEDKDAFVAKSEADRDAQIKAAPVVKVVDTEVAKAHAENEVLRKRLEALEGHKVVAEFAKKAVELGLPEAKGEVLRKAYSGDAAAQTEVETLIKGLTEQVKTGKLFDELGTIKGDDTTSPKAKVMAKVAEMRKADATLTDAKAIAKIAADTSLRALWNEYKAAGAAA